MKYLKHCLFLFLILVAGFYSCQKNNDFTQIFDENSAENSADFFAYGKKINRALVRLIQNKEILKAVVEECSKMEDGDFEVLVKDLFAINLGEQGKGLDLFAKEIATMEEMEPLEVHNYLTQQAALFPNLLIGYRHNIPSKEAFEAKEHSIEKVVLVDGNQREDKVLYGINSQFEKVVVENEIFLTVQKSERHDRFGELSIGFAKGRENEPNQGSLGNIETRSISSPCPVNSTPEPTGGCAAAPVPTGFTASMQNGFVQLSWNGVLSQAGTWNRYLIEKVDPINSQSWTYTVYSCGFTNHTVFQTGNLTPNTNFQFRIRSYQLKNNSGNTAICQSNWTNYISVNTNASVVAQEAQNFLSENNLVGKVSFTWQPPANGNTTGYVIDRYNPINGIWSNIKSVNATTTNTVYNHPSSWKGVKQLFRIRNIWGGNYSTGQYDIVYPAYRTSGAPIRMHGVNIPNLDIYEPSELGFPEIHVAVTKAVGTTGGSKEAEGITGYSPCVIHHYGLFFKYWPRSGTFYPSAMYSTTINLYPQYWLTRVSSIYPVNIINNWYVDQYNKVLFVNLAEVDETEEHATTKKVTRSIDAKYTTKGATIPGIPNLNPFDLEVGTKLSTEKVFTYPEDNIPMGSFDLFYWESIHKTYGLQGSNCNAVINSTGGTRINTNGSCN